jgi:SpoVK/Ycf46/Vps4 family AAA+-type ATPase
MTIKRKHNSIDNILTYPNTIKIKKIRYNGEIQNKTIKNIDNLIEIIDNYDTTYYEFKRLKNLLPELISLNKMIGMKNLKESITKMIIYYCQDLDCDEMNHIALFGEPGTGKTTVARLIGNILIKLKYWKEDNFFIASKDTLVAPYVGQTAIKTQNFIKKCNKGIIFIDEVYSIGNASDKENSGFDREAIDVLCSNMSANKNVIFIIAGYAKQVKDQFFKKNPGLERRFPFQFTIDKYDENELYLILLKKINDIYWYLEDNEKDKEKIINLIKENINYFEYVGGDIENLLNKIKIISSQRTFCVSNFKKCLINFDDIKLAMEEHKKNYKKIEEKNVSYLRMYL